MQRVSILALAAVATAFWGPSGRRGNGGFELSNANVDWR